MLKLSRRHALLVAVVFGGSLAPVTATVDEFVKF